MREREALSQDTVQQDTRPKATAVQTTDSVKEWVGRASKEACANMVIQLSRLGWTYDRALDVAMRRRKG